MNVYLVSIGSNYCKEEKLLFARTNLNTIFPSVKYGEELETKPLNMTNPALFLNQVAQFTTPLSIEEVTVILKELELLAGRTPESKQKEEIPLDIEILMHNEDVVRPEDMVKEYIIKGIESLK